MEHPSADDIMNLRFTISDLNRDPGPFQDAVLTYYRKFGRRLPWREEPSPYNVFVSEIMLQQTQVSRVSEKFQEFIQEIPDFESLASVTTDTLLNLWRGLGYNRRALALRDGACLIVKNSNGTLPDSPDELEKLKGIGKNTAASICAFAYNKPLVFIETNIRRSFIHFFFDGTDDVDDKQILPLVGQSLYRPSPRDWYNALMDTGSAIKAKIANPNRKSRHYRKQPPFPGSFRQVRGEILKTLTYGPLTLSSMKDHNTVLSITDIHIVKKASGQLVLEGFIAESDGIYRIAD